jgi:aldehyde:ferredoxin oxidoreductase
VALGYALSPTGADHLNAAHDSAFEREADPAVSAISLHDIKPLGILEPAQVLSLDAKKVRNFVLLQNAWSMVNVIDFCLFCMAPEVSMYSLEDMTHAVSAATGWNISLAEMMAWGERGVNLSRIYNIREGSGAAQDTLPNRLFEPLKEGPFDGVAIPKNEFENAVKLYYAMRGWDAQGRPRTVQLQMLDIAWAAESYDGNSS